MRYVIEIIGIRILKLSFKLYDEIGFLDILVVFVFSVCFGYYFLNGINVNL